MLWADHSDNSRIQANTNDILLTSLGFNNYSKYTVDFINDPLKAEEDMEDRFYINYLGRASEDSFVATAHTFS